MNNLILNLDKELDESLYVQIYNIIKNGIISGNMEKGSKLPSLRKLAEENEISITTVETAYTQLLVEGYVETRPKSGYYVSKDITDSAAELSQGAVTERLEDLLPTNSTRAKRIVGADKPMIYDQESFEFSK